MTERIRFVTTNPGKVREATAYFDGIAPLEQFDYDYEEIQSDSLAPIVERGAREASDACPGEDPVIVDDSGLFVDSLEGFPGPYSSFVDHTIGHERVWELVEAASNRSAAFRCVVGYADSEGVTVFEGAVRGQIVAPRGDGGFGYDPIFEHDGQTFAEMDTAEKNALSHRGRALAKVADWLAEP